MTVICALLAATVPAFAAEFRGDETNPEVSGTIEDDVYVAGQDVTVPAAISGELIAVGRKISLSGSTQGSLLAAAQEVSISGSVGGTARTAGQDLNLTGSVEGDLLAGGQSLQIGSNGSVGRDLLASAREMEIAGTVGGDVKGSVQKLTITGTVEGDVKVDVEELILKSGARIGGDLIYTSDNKVAVPSGATVVGKIVRRTPAQPDNIGDVERIVLALLRTIGGALVLGLILAWLLPGFLPRVSSALRTSPLASFGVGIAGLLLIPIVVILLFVLAAATGAGGALPVALTAGYFVMMAFAQVIIVFTLGAWIVRISVHNSRAGFVKVALALIVGAVLYAVISVIPIAGGIAGALAVVFAMGAGLIALFRQRKEPPYPGDFAGRNVRPVPAPAAAKTSVSAPI